MSKTRLNGIRMHTLKDKAVEPGAYETQKACAELGCHRIGIGRDNLIRMGYGDRFAQ